MAVFAWCKWNSPTCIIVPAKAVVIMSKFSKSIPFQIVVSAIILTLLRKGCSVILQESYKILLNKPDEF